MWVLLTVFSQVFSKNSEQKYDGKIGKCASGCGCGQGVTVLKKIGGATGQYHVEFLHPELLPFQA